MKLCTASYIANILLFIALVALALIECNPPKNVQVDNIDSTQYWKTKTGIAVASVKLTEEQLGQATMERDSLAELLQTKPKFIKSYYTIYQRSRDTIIGQGDPVIIYESSGQIKSLSEIFLSPWYAVQATIEASGNGSVADVQTYDTLTIVTREVSEGGLFNRKRFIEIDAINSNPHNIIEGLKTYRRPAPKPKKWGIGIVGGYGTMDAVSLRPFVGVGVQYNLIRF